MTEETAAQFHVGQIVHHVRFDYRGVVFNVDAEFSGDEEWYEQVALSRPPKDKPWYHVLPDGAEHTTYVAERNLEADAGGNTIDHPLLSVLFGEWRQGSYAPKDKPN